MLINNVTFKGISVTGAYIKVVSPTISEDQKSISFFLKYSATENEEPFNVMALTCPYEITGENPIAQAYAYLKTLDDFKESS